MGRDRRIRRPLYRKFVGPPVTGCHRGAFALGPAALSLGTEPMRRGGRVAEGARLESVYTGNRIVGSNPTPSASATGFSALRLLKSRMESGDFAVLPDQA